MWLALGITLAAGIASLHPCIPEYLIRWTGLFLHFSGVMTVALGLHTTRKLFGLPSLATTTGSWLKRFPLRKRKVIHASGFAFAGRATVSSHGCVTHAPPANRTIDQRLDALERSIVLLHDRSEEHTSELQSLMRISYAVFCLKKKKTIKT